MRLERVDASQPREVLRGLRGAVLGAGPAIAVGAASASEPLPTEVAAGTGVVITTSGSTGVPKSVALSRSALTSSALATADRLGEGRWLLALPAGYIAGVQVMVRALITGGEPAVLAGSFTPQTFAAAALSMASSRGGVRVPTFTSLVPAQLQTLLDAEGAGFHTGISSFEAVLVGGQALPAALADRAASAGVRTVRTYGSTETSGGCVYDGVPLRDVEVRVVDGEVQVGGPTLADGYVGRPDLTAAAFIHGDGARWYRTGDAGTFDGALRVTGRIDNVIVSGGINVSLDLVERIVRMQPELEQAVVVGMADDRWGEVPVIVVAASERGADPAGALAGARAAVAADLGAPARPREVVVIDALPVLASGKVDRVGARAAAHAAVADAGDGQSAP